MGTWGTGIFSDDNAADLRDDYRDFIGDGLSSPEATDRLLAEWGSSLSREPEYAATFWLALAVTQWKCGRLEDRVKAKALAGCGKTYLLMKTLSAPCRKIGFFPLVLPLWGRLQRGKAGCGRPFSAACLSAIDDGSALRPWLAGKFERKRKSVLDAVRQQIESSQPPPRKIPKRVRAACEWEPTELIGYRLLSGDHIILRVSHLVSDKGGVYPACEPLDWQGKEFPSREIIDDLPIRPRLPGTYGLHSTILILPAGKRRPDDRIVRLNLKRLAGTPRQVSSTVVTWKNLDEKLKFLFGFL